MDVAAELLVKTKLIEANHLREAEEIQKASGGCLVDILVERGRVSRSQIQDMYATRLGIPTIDLTRDALEPESHYLLPVEQCRELEVLPLGITQAGALNLAMTDPTNLSKIDDVRFSTGLQVEPVLVDRSQLYSVLDELFPETANIESQIRELDAMDLEVQEVATDKGEAVDITKAEAEQAPIVSLVNLLLKQAILSGASDIHLEPKEKNMRVRFRVDGVLVDKDPIGPHHRTGVTARIKVLAQLDITEKRIPQDGAFTVAVDGRRVDFRVSTFPTPSGEKSVLRILDGSAACLDFDDLGFPERVASGIKEIMNLHDGIFLVTGPTGSGKSTTLYTLLKIMDSPERNTVTLEDPIEYQIGSITQGQTNPKAGFTFASGLRAILRQDPDVILVGEVRDLETARIAVQASLTGHLVFSTLHTNSACEAIMRLQDMGLEPFMLTAALRGALAQRLARRLCTQCREEHSPSGDVRELFSEHGVPLSETDKLMGPVGCKACNGLGYKGRLGLYELFQMTDKARRAVAGGAEPKEIVHVAREDGYRTLRENGLEKVRAGLTSLEEVFRVT
jgi:type IV pilus assembly protein PilB